MSDNRVPLLEFKNVTVLKSGRTILDSVSIKIYEKENVAILGPNGAGKSTFIKTITREYYPLPAKEGFEFKILGEEVWNVFDLRLQLGIVSESLLRRVCARAITGIEMILSGFFSSIGLYHEKPTREMRKKADEIMELLEISHLQEKPLNTMSSGESRRFVIGRALVHEPKALILDEPTASLDLHASYKFTNMLRKITAQGTSIIIVTHKIVDIIPEIGRVVLMEEGRFVKDAAKEEVLTDGNISKFFSVPVNIHKKDGYYYALRA